MARRVLHYIWYSSLFTGAFIILSRLLNGITGGLRKGAASSLGL